MGPTNGPMVRSMRRTDDIRGLKVARGTARRILRFAAPYKRLLLLFFGLVVVTAVIGAANPLIYREIINEGIVGQQTGLVIALALAVAGLAILDAVLSLGSRYVSAKVGEGLVFSLRTKVFSHVQRQPISFFTRAQTGALVSRLNNDVLGAQQAFTDVLSTMVGNLISVALVLAAMFVLSWKLTLVALILLPLFALPARWLGRRLQSIMRERYDLTADMNTIMVERFNVSGALLVKLFGRPADEDASFHGKAGRVRDIGVKQAMYGRIFFISLMLTASLATALVYGWGGVLTVKGALDVGTLVALAAYLGRLYGPLTALSNIHVDIMTTLVSFERVFEVLDLKPAVADKDSAVALPRGPASIEFDHVSFSYPAAEEVSLASLEAVALSAAGARKDVLFDVSFEAEPGQLVALVGPSGAGKTTISQLVPRLYDATQGAVRVSGIDVRDATSQSLHDVVGVVTQDAHLFHDSIRANLLYAKPDATEEELREALAAAQILPFIDALPDGLDTLVGDRGYRLSGGEKQRVAIARLLLKAPDVVVLDEATAHLDSESEAALQRALDTALAGRTSLVIAHRLSTVRDADQILVIDEGRIVEHGTHEQLLDAGGLYAELYETQFRPRHAATATRRELALAIA
ncbi:MAG: ABC transporter ATP-binding protein [Thermoleophilia bacterium]|nr:ABC transporter ATP-binding protein [Thermoleophilia bacterium]